MKKHIWLFEEFNMTPDDEKSSGFDYTPVCEEIAEDSNIEKIELFKDEEEDAKIDLVFLKTGKILAVTDACVSLWDSVEEFHASDDGMGEKYLMFADEEEDGQPVEE